MNKEFENTSTEDLEKLALKIKNELEKRQNKNLSNKVLINLYQEMIKVCPEKNKLNKGSWTKLVSSVDRSKTNGYSLRGKFINYSNKKEYYKKGSIFVDCVITGSRNYPVKTYRLFYLDENGTIRLLMQDDTPDYAINFWDTIEQLLNKN